MISKKILFRCDGGSIPEIGMGHVVRCLHLGEALKRRHVQSVFLTRSTPEVTQLIRAGGHACLDLQSGDETTEVLDVIRNEKPDIVVWDRLDTDPDTCRAIKKLGALLVTLDDQGEGQVEADITVNAMVFGGDTCYKGFEYVILPDMKRDCRDPSRLVRRIFISFGGYDHHDMTRKVLTSLRKLDGAVELHVVVGLSYSDSVDLRTLFSNESRLIVYRNPKNFSHLLMESDLAILSGGLTLLEALAGGIPCIAIGQYRHQVDTIQRLEEVGAVINLGSAEDVQEGALLSTVERLIQDGASRVTLASKAQSLIDGYGLVRVRELVSVIEDLDWDSNFFGLNIAYLYPKRINEDIVQFAMRKCQEGSIDCLYYLCDCHDSRSVLLAEKYGFHFVDIRMVFFKHLYISETAQVNERDTGDFTLREARKEDIDQLRSIASNSYIDSRYYFDRHFPQEICERFYSDWIARSCDGYADFVIVADRSGKIVGYIAGKMKSHSMGIITLVGIARHFAGGGIGKALVNASLKWFQEQGVEAVDVVTQGRNYAAQQLYQSCGFKTSKTELWYHKWFQGKQACD